MNASPMLYVRTVIGDILRADPMVMVQNVFDEDAFVNGKIVAYPYCVSLNYDNESENGRGHGLAMVSFDILCNAIAQADPSKKGTASEYISEIVSRVKHRIDEYPIETLKAGNDTRYRTHLVSLAVDGASGDFTSGDTKLRVGITGTARIITILQ